jgi:outer membrane protein
VIQVAPHMPDATINLTKSRLFDTLNTPLSIGILNIFEFLRGGVKVKKIHLYLACVFVFSMLIVPYHAFALGLEAGIGYWKQDPSGTLAYQGTDLDLANDLNYDSTNRAMVRIKAELPLILPNLYFMATPMSFDGTGSKDVNFNYGGQTFQANVPIQSSVKLDHYDLAFYYTFLNTISLGKLNLDLGLDGRKIDFEGTINQDTLGLTKSKSLTLYVPMIYAGLQVKPISAFSIEVEGRGIKLGDNSYYDWIGRVKIKPVGPLFISGGYRSETIKIDQSDVKADVKFTGPFVEVGLTF